MVVEERYFQCGGCGTKNSGPRGPGVRAPPSHATRFGAIRKRKARQRDKHSSPPWQSAFTPKHTCNQLITHDIADRTEAAWLRICISYGRTHPHHETRQDRHKPRPHRSISQSSSHPDSSGASFSKSTPADIPAPMAEHPSVILQLALEIPAGPRPIRARSQGAGSEEPGCVQAA